MKIRWPRVDVDTLIRQGEADLAAYIRSEVTGARAGVADLYRYMGEQVSLGSGPPA